MKRLPIPATSINETAKVAIIFLITKYFLQYLLKGKQNAIKFCILLLICIYFKLIYFQIDYKLLITTVDKTAKKPNRKYTFLNKRSNSLPAKGFFLPQNFIHKL